ncbi:MAG: hypothetical protein LBB45_09770 [Methanobrevibacter sp.]|jgi:hypothetical protein|nr:hypothetical protein [Candidatus Methanovirga basalitermitum]
MSVATNDIEDAYLQKIKKISINKGKTRKEVLNNIIKDGLEFNENKKRKNIHGNGQ